MKDPDVVQTTGSLAAGRTTLWRPLAAVLFALTAAGCSGPSTGTGGGSDHGSQGTAFSHCMRDHGVTNFPTRMRQASSRSTPSRTAPRLT